MSDHPTEPTQPPVTAPYGPYGGSQPPTPVGYGNQLPAPGWGPAPVGKIRSTGLCILLTVVTFGIYPLVWYYLVHEEMKRHSRDGLGGVVALLLAFFVGIVMPYLTSSEVGRLYEVRGMARPVSALTGLWYFPGAIIVIGPLIWFIQTNVALNNYWRYCGVR
jgi:hypothetical protein